jgi:hypothetical protein
LTEDRPPARVRVTGPPRQSSIRPRSRLGDVHEQTAIGGVYLRSLLREQLALAVGVLLVVGLTLGALPLVFHVWPALADVDIIGIPVAWALLGVLVYPFLLLLGWRYVRSVERNERDFADLVDGSGSEQPP